MTTPVIPIAGTWGEIRERDWFRPNSRWWNAALRAGLIVLDKNKPFMWSTGVDGLPSILKIIYPPARKHATWIAAAESLIWYSHWMGADPVSLVCHSHGGQLALYAMANGLRVDVLLTLATPVRADVLRAFRAGRERPRKWVHIYTDEPWGIPWQRFGEAGDGYLGWRYEFPEADQNIRFDGIGHGEIMDYRLWERKSWFSFLKRED